MSVPQVTQSQIDAMNRIAEQKYGVKNEPYQPEQPEQEQEQEIIQEPVVQEQEYEQVEEEQELEESELEEPVVKKEDNFKKLRIRASQAERERDEALEYIRRMQQQSQPVQKVQEPEEDDFEVAIEDEALIEGKQLKQLVREIKNLKKTVRQYETKSQVNSQQTIELRLRNQFPDFDKVVTRENLVQLREVNPDLADTILKNEDQFKENIERAINIVEYPTHKVERGTPITVQTAVNYMNRADFEMRKNKGKYSPEQYKIKHEELAKKLASEDGYDPESF